MNEEKKLCLSFISIVFTLCFLLAGWHLETNANMYNQVCNVGPVRIIDGDTFQAVTVTMIYPALQIAEITGFRLLGVDTPERGEDGYQEAKDYLQKRIDGKLIHLRFKPEPEKIRDSFGRFLVDVFLCTKDGLISINEEIIEKKLGKEYPR